LVDELADGVTDRRRVDSRTCMSVGDKDRDGVGESRVETLLGVEEMQGAIKRMAAGRHLGRVESGGHARRGGDCSSEGRGREQGRYVLEEGCGAEGRRKEGNNWQSSRRGFPCW
jgi:hypothetical protein